MSSLPGNEGDTTVWYTSYWHFIAAYANNRFGNDWSLSAEQSLAFYSGYYVVPKQIIIRGSKHTPLNPDVVIDAMQTFYILLRQEENVLVSSILGHFFFVYIHPYMDGNGRTARFIMNAMLVTGDYSWTIIPREKRNEYMSALETASINGDIIPFAEFIYSLIGNVV